MHQNNSPDAFDYYDIEDARQTAHDVLISQIQGAVQVDIDALDEGVMTPEELNSILESIVFTVSQLSDENDLDYWSTLEQVIGEHYVELYEEELNAIQ